MRRKRFLVSAEYPGCEPSKIFVLAYSSEDARSYMESAGYKILYIKAVKRRRAKNASVSPKWQVDTNRLQEALTQLDIIWPVYIRRTASMTRGGSHVLKYDVTWSLLRHNITVDKRVSVKDASRILWHELAHAAQSERAAEAYAREAGKESRLVIAPLEAFQAWNKAAIRDRHLPYKERRCEIEANYVAELNKKVILATAA